MSIIRARAVLLAAIPVAAADVTWNPSDIDASITLTNSNLTATATSAGDRGGRATAGQTAGNKYCEFLTGSTWTGGDTCCGLLKGGVSMSNFGNDGSFGAGLFVNGVMWNGSSQGGTGLGAIPVNTPVGCAVNFTTRKVWFTLDGVTWSYSGNPVAGTGGATGGWTGGDTVFPAFCFGGNGNVLTGRFKASQFTLTPPVGFSAWS